MLVQALARYADTYLADQLAEMSVETKGVAYLIEIAEDGRFLGVRDRTRKTEAGQTLAESMVVPRSPVNRNTGIHPLLTCDAVEYVVGPSVGRWTAEKDLDKHTAHHGAFVAFLALVARETGDPGLEACARFYASPERVALARADMEAPERKVKSGFVVALSVRPAGLDPDRPGGPVFDRLAVRDYWRRFYAEKSAARHSRAGEGVCLISGKRGPIAITHERIKRVANLGGQPAGVSLMSFDKDAFCSYGWEQNLNSPVSPERAAAYVLALNDLLLPGEHRRGSSPDKVLRTRSDYAGVGFLYWTREPVDEDLMAEVERPSAEDVKRLLAAPYTGRQVDVDENEFLLLTVSGNGGRLVVHDWFREKLGRVRDNVRQWFSQLQVADPFHGGGQSTPPTLWHLLQAMSPPDRVDKKINAGRAISLIRRALHGFPLGRSLLAAALGRLRVAQGADRLRPARLGLIRMCVNDILTREGKGGSPVTEALDEGQANPAYLCGRLLAMYERLQYDAHREEVGQTVADRYYGLASTYPALAIPKLETLSRAHLKKLRRDKKPAAIAIGRRIDELVSRFNESGFPGQLSLEDQGRFAIGYHHQRAEDQRRAALAKAEARQAEETQEEAE